MQLFVNDLTVMDFSYLCPKRGMVGESWIVDVILDGDLNDESMIQDFGKVKKNLKKLIDEYVDHKLLVPAEHTATSIRNDDSSEQVEVAFTCQDGKMIVMYCPADAYAFIYDTEVTMPSVGAYLREIIATHLPDNVDNIELKLRTEVITTPFYHYTHGLKKHDGNCQRIAHGHRSRIDLFVDGKQSADCEAYWAKRWEDIYIASREDIIPLESRQSKTQLSAPEAYSCFAYEATQGYFELVMPTDECEIIETDSTVECLAQFVYEQQRERHAGKACQVFAYEGVGKGAMVKDK